MPCDCDVIGIARRQKPPGPCLTPSNFKSYVHSYYNVGDDDGVFGPTVVTSSQHKV